MSGDHVRRQVPCPAGISGIRQNSNSFAPPYAIPPLQRFIIYFSWCISLIIPLWSRAPLLISHHYCHRCPTHTPTQANPHPPTRVLRGFGRSDKGFVGFEGFYGFNGFKKPAPGSEDINQKYIVENVYETN
jgi:hypothetical protein